MRLYDSVHRGSLCEYGTVAGIFDTKETGRELDVGVVVALSDNIFLDEHQARVWGLNFGDLAVVFHKHSLSGIRHVCIVVIAVEFCRVRIGVGFEHEIRVILVVVGDAAHATERETVVYALCHGPVHAEHVA